tara:strand:- start:36 stop:653 length:618 start_codon:yes stop_codon:yes gene_type:complete
MVQEIELKEKHFHESTFIGGWYIPESLCDEIIDFFHFNEKYAKDGQVGDAEGRKVKKEVKESTDLSIGAYNKDNVVGVYRNHLQAVLTNYLKKYENANRVAYFDVVENFNIQKYPKGGGYKEWHSECSGNHSSVYRHLVFMTYLNNVEDGGTEFLHQNLSTKAEKGLTLIWPVAWTHTHRGIVSNTKEKYIMTGWYSFIRGEKDD